MKEILLTQGKVALVDDEDYERLSKVSWWYGEDRNRARTGWGQPMSREVLQTSELIDHKDGNPLNNQKSNLRKCSSSQNQQNKKKTKRKTSSKYKGVCFYKLGQKWQAMIGYTDAFGQKVQVFLGYFTVEEEAGKAYDKAARLYHREFAALNFPGEGERSCL